MSLKPYSDFLKIDLHIHSDKSKETKEGDYKGTFSVDKLHNKLVENNVEIFSLTDHNCINISAYEEYYSKYPGVDNPLLLIGVELDIDANDKRYHSLIIFSSSDIANARRISGALENHYNGKGFSLKERKLTLDQIVVLFPEDDFFFIPHAGSGSRSLVGAYKEDIPYAQKMLLLMPSCALEKVSQKSIEMYEKGFNSVMPESFRNKKDIAYIQFSDNHNIEQYPCCHKGENGDMDHEFYYVKGGKNYETLRLAFIDPESRIKSFEQFKALTSSRDRIEFLSISGSESIENIDLTFSPHLNVIIGGRSSGKSLLMSLFGKKIDRLPSWSTYDHLLANTVCNIKSDRDALPKESTAVSLEPILIKQGDIVRYFEQGKLSELAEKAGKSVERKSALAEIAQNKSNLTQLIDEMASSYDSLFYQLQSHRQYVLHAKTISDSLNSTFVVTLDYDSLHNEYSEAVGRSEKTLENLKTLSTSLKAVEDDCSIIFIEDDLRIFGEFTELIGGKILHVEDSIKALNIRLHFIDEANSYIIAANHELGGTSQRKSEASSAIKQLTDDVGASFGLCHDVCKRAKILEDFDCHVQRSFTLQENTDFKVEVKPNDTTKTVMFDSLKTPNTSASVYLNLLRLLNNEISIKNIGGNTPDNLRKKCATNFKVIFQCYDCPVESLKYNDGSTSKGNSPGYNSEKYLEILLSHAKGKLVFVDQPEDNLGNNFIAEKLVDLIRRQKFDGQVFLVTHNPAIVVYGDAESIIVAENNAGKIRYKQVVLEDKSAQREICKILDGGEYIFDRRAKKYNIQRILTEEANG